MKTAVILFNLGGPDRPENIEPFLMNFFTDKNIIGAPYPVRYFLAKLISRRRSKREAGESYGFLGGRSPLLKNSEKQARALDKALAGKGEYKCWVCMNYWHPMAEEVAREVKEWGAEKVLLLPLYPQFSTTTTKSSFEKWDKAARKILADVPTAKICCYPWENGFVKASAQNIERKYEDIKNKAGQNPRILFSAHGLPEKIIRRGDPYQWQCEESAKQIIGATAIENPDWQICYQSRVGPLKWIGPSTEEALHRAASDNIPVIIYPHAFTQEHVETLVELNIEYRELAEKLDIPAYEKVETVGVEKYFIEGLRDIILKAKDMPGICSDKGKRLCPSMFAKCPMGKAA